MDETTYSDLNLGVLQNLTLWMPWELFVTKHRMSEVRIIGINLCATGCVEYATLWDFEKILARK